MFDLGTANTRLNITAALIAALALSGCASGAISREAPPRALAASPQAPSCLLLCFITQTFTDTEEDISTSGGGDFTNTVENEETVSGPAIDLGMGDDGKTVNATTGAPQ